MTYVLVDKKKYILTAILGVGIAAEVTWFKTCLDFIQNTR